MAWFPSEHHVRGFACRFPSALRQHNPSGNSVYASHSLTVHSALVASMQTYVKASLIISLCSDTVIILGPGLKVLVNIGDSVKLLLHLWVSATKCFVSKYDFSPPPRPLAIMAGYKRLLLLSFNSSGNRI